MHACVIKDIEDQKKRESGNMEGAPGKTLERAISQKALQMSSYFACQVCVLGFLCGVCVTYFFLAALGSFGTSGLGVFFSSVSDQNLQNLTSVDYDIKGIGGLDSISKMVNKGMDVQQSLEQVEEERVLLLYSAWSFLLNGSSSMMMASQSNVPVAPHLEDCKMRMQLNRHHDNRGENGSFPPWRAWKGLLGWKLPLPTPESNQEQSIDGDEAEAKEPNPPWISGSDEDNIPLTRRVQHDIWAHQHPPNCSDPQLRFLVADWETLPGFGIGAQIAKMCGLLRIAIKEQRILVTGYYNRADHDGCKGSSRSSWACYFIPETSKECQTRAFELVKSQEAWKKGILKRKENYSSKDIWAGRIPRKWGSPWSHFQPTTEIDGTLVTHHRKMDRRWWRAQAVRYLMRFQSEYTCHLLNVARHEAFGMQAARMVLSSATEEWPEASANRSQDDIEKLVWSNQKPWIPRPMLSMHVRMGDKASEMKVVGFERYMNLAERIRRRFPNLKTIWLSTEMQEVIDQAKLYPHWNFYYTKVARQSGNMAMARYEASLGRVTGTNYPITNFLMATESDYFVGALGSTWCFLIDGMRNTGGKVMAGYLSVNKDRFW